MTGSFHGISSKPVGFKTKRLNTFSSAKKRLNHFFIHLTPPFRFKKRKGAKRTAPDTPAPFFLEKA
jgi:hypothetical protein